MTRDVWNFLEAAPDDENARRDYFVRLLTILSYKVDRYVMAEAIRRALEVKPTK